MKTYEKATRVMICQAVIQGNKYVCQSLRVHNVCRLFMIDEMSQEHLDRIELGLLKNR